MMRVYFIHANQLASIIVRITNKAEVVYFIIVLKFRVQWSRMVKGKFIDSCAPALYEF
jgi:hypothetical protein